VEIADRIGIAAILLLELLQALQRVVIRLLDILVPHRTAVTASIIVGTALWIPLAAVVAAVGVPAIGVVPARLLAALLPALLSLLALLTLLAALLPLLSGLL